jgi:hypothetical protein
MHRKLQVGLAAAAVAVMAMATASLSGSPQPATTFTFAAAGDFTLGAGFKATAGAVKATNPAFLLGLGDFSYEKGGEASWCKHWIKELAYPNVLLIAGNHDTGESGGGNIDDYITHCGQPFKDDIKGVYGRQYYFDFPAAAPLARFIMITPGLGGDTGGLDTEYVEGSPGYKFTQGAIDDARSKAIKWVFVGMHKNYVSVMKKDNEISRDKKRTFMTMLLNKRVDVIFQGHEHGYERSKQLATNTSTCPLVPTNAFRAACVVDSDDALVKGAGTVIHVLGTGGKDMRTLDRTDSEFKYFVDRFSWVDKQTFGFGSFTLSPTQLSYKFVRSKGEPFADQFTITEPAK